MQKLRALPLYKIYGYAGIIPFVLFLAGLMVFSNDTPRTLYLDMMLLCYSGLILSFLAGAHWPMAVKGRDNIRLSLSMAPTVICILLIYMGLTYTPLWPLLAVFVLFWHQYLIDRKYYSLLDFADGYLAFRLRITSIVSGLVLVSFLVSL